MPEGKKHSSSINEQTSIIPSKSSKKVSAAQQSFKRKGDPFLKSTKSRKENFFDIGFEESCHEDRSVLSNLSQISNVDIRDIFKNQPKNDNRIKKHNLDDLFNVEFEESKEESCQLVTSVMQSTSQNEKDICNEDVSISFRQPDLFRSSKVKNNPIDIDLEKSHEILLQNGKQSQVSTTLSQKSVDECSESKTKINTIFGKQKKTIKNAFQIDFEESIGSPAVVRNVPQNVTASSHTSNQDITFNFDQPELFKKSKTRSDQAFAVDLEESGILTQNSQDLMISGTSQRSVDELSQEITQKALLFQNEKRTQISTIQTESDELKNSSDIVLSAPQSSPQPSKETCSQDATVNIKKPELFKNVNMESTDAFSIDLEESEVLTQNSQNSKVSSVSSQDSINELSQRQPRKCLLFQNEKRNEKNNVDVDFEESQNSSKIVLSAPQSSSQPSKETCSQDATVNINKPDLFKNTKIQSTDAFNIDLEESQDKTQNTQYSQPSNTFSQKSLEALSQGESERNPIFHKRKSNENKTFEVQFEESGVNSQRTQDSQSANSNKEIINDASVNFGRRDPFRESTQRRLTKSFDVDFEESRSVANFFNTSPGTAEKFKIQSFRKSSNEIEDELDVNFNEAEVNVDGLTEKSNSALTVNRESLTSFTAGASRMNTTRTSTNLDQSSFNDDNLGHWMSDHSEGEIEIPQRVDLETDCRKTLAPDDIPPPPDFEDEEEEDHIQQLQLKLKEIVESAKSSKPQHIIPVLPKPKITEKPKKPEIKRTVTPKSSLKKPASFATKRLYNHIIGKIRPKYGLDSVVQAEDLVILICDVVKMVMRRKGYQKKLINELKVEMAKMGVIETTFQFYEFVRDFLPYEFRLKVVPCIQPGTNIVYPPKDATNPFDKII